MLIKQFDILQVDLGSQGNHIQGGVRPCVVVQSDIGAEHAQVLQVIPLTTRKKRKYLPVHKIIRRHPETGLNKDSMLLGEQLRVIDREQICYKMGAVTKAEDRKAVLMVYMAIVFDSMAEQYLDCITQAVKHKNQFVG